MTGHYGWVGPNICMQTKMSLTMSVTARDTQRELLTLVLFHPAVKLESEDNVEIRFLGVA